MRLAATPRHGSTASRWERDEHDDLEGRDADRVRHIWRGVSAPRSGRRAERSPCGPRPCRDSSRQASPSWRWRPAYRSRPAPAPRSERSSWGSSCRACPGRTRQVPIGVRARDRAGDWRGPVLRAGAVRDGPAVRGHPDRVDHLTVQDDRLVFVTIPLAVTGRPWITGEAAPLVVASGLFEVAGLVAFTIGARLGIAVAAVLGRSSRQSRPSPCSSAPGAPRPDPRSSAWRLSLRVSRG